MSRPRKRRRVCALPRVTHFGPPNASALPVITMSVEEYEAIRLIDDEGLTQEECAQMMNVARTTVQKIYVDARQKLARALVRGKQLKIDGGDYDLCDLNDKDCCHRRCRYRGGRIM